jgi:hypothetical protein
MLLLVALFCILATCLRASLNVRRAEARKELKRLENLVLFLETEAYQIPANRGKALVINAMIIETEATLRELKKQFPGFHTCRCGETAEVVNCVMYCPRCGTRNHILPAGPGDSSKYQKIISHHRTTRTVPNLSQQHSRPTFSHCVVVFKPTH